MKKSSVKRAVRELCADVEARLPIDVEAVAEARGVKVRRVPLEEGVSGMLVLREGRALIAVNEEHHINRQRFTIAHELGHLKLHSGEATVFIDDQSRKTFYRDPVASEGVDEKEIEANAFAAELLMPERDVLRALDGEFLDPADEERVRALAHDFGVSPQAMSVRLSTLGRFAMG